MERGEGLFVGPALGGVDAPEHATRVVTTVAMDAVLANKLARRFGTPARIASRRGLTAMAKV